MCESESFTIQNRKALQQSEKVGQTSTSERHNRKRKEVGRRLGEEKRHRDYVDGEGWVDREAGCEKT